MLQSSGESTPIINTETTSSIRYVPIQEGTYVKPVLQGGEGFLFVQESFTGLLGFTGLFGLIGLPGLDLLL